MPLPFALVAPAERTEVYTLGQLSFGMYAPLDMKAVS